MRETSQADKIAITAMRFLKGIQKKDARKTTLEGCTKETLKSHLKSIDSEDHYSHKMLNAKNKFQLIQSIVEEEGIQNFVDGLAEELDEMGVNVQLLEELSSFNV